MRIGRFWSGSNRWPERSVSRFRVWHSPWLLHQPAVDTVLAGASRPEQVTENAKAADVRLSPDVLSRLDEILGIDRSRKI